MMQPLGWWRENIRPQVIACIWGPLGFGSDEIWGFAVAEFCGTATTGVGTCTFWWGLELVYEYLFCFFF